MIRLSFCMSSSTVSISTDLRAMGNRPRIRDGSLEKNSSCKRNLNLIRSFVAWHFLASYRGFLEGIEFLKLLGDIAVAWEAGWKSFHYFRAGTETLKWESREGRRGETALLCRAGNGSIDEVTVKTFMCGDTSFLYFV